MIRTGVSRSAAKQGFALIEMLERGADRGYIGEPISQLEHALQAAAAADRAGAGDEATLAALCHDIGHLADVDGASMAGLGAKDHETIGAQLLLKAGCSAALADLVASHVAAKRYLCWRDSLYLEKLSLASRGTLEWQGGPMDGAEAHAFAQRPNLAAILALRSWDEAAKVPSARVPGLPDYTQRLVRHIESAAC